MADLACRALLFLACLSVVSCQSVQEGTGDDVWESDCGRERVGFTIYEIPELTGVIVRVQDTLVEVEFEDQVTTRWPLSVYRDGEYVAYLVMDGVTDGLVRAQVVEVVLGDTVRVGDVVLTRLHY